MPFTFARSFVVQPLARAVGRALRCLRHDIRHRARGMLLRCGGPSSVIPCTGVHTVCTRRAVCAILGTYEFTPQPGHATRRARVDARPCLARADDDGDLGGGDDDADNCDIVDNCDNGDDGCGASDNNKAGGGVTKRARVGQSVRAWTQEQSLAYSTCPLCFSKVLVCRVCNA